MQPTILVVFSYCLFAILIASELEQGKHVAGN